MFFINSFYIASHGAINFLIWTSSLFFSFRLFTYRLNFSVLTIESSASIHWLTGLTNLFPRFWLFLVLFWMLWMLVNVHKPCHVPHASRKTTTWRTIFTERLFGVSKEWVNLGHTLSWWLMIKRWLKSFWQYI